MPRKILVVDDMKSMRSLIRTVLHELGLMDVEDAEDGQAALNILRHSKFDLMISDWNMPRVDGLMLLKAVRADEATKTMPVIMLTAESTREQVLEMVALNVSGYIKKPFKPEDLITAVRRVIPA